MARTLWTHDLSGRGVAPRERVLPTSEIHLAVRTGGSPVRLYEGDDDRVGRSVGRAVVAGVRSAAYLKAGSGGRTIGVQFAPGGFLALFGLPATEIAERHVALERIAPSLATELEARLAGCDDAGEALDEMSSVLEHALRGRPEVEEGAWLRKAVERLYRGWAVGRVVAESGWSHRHFIRRFRESVGVTPKRYARLARFQRVLAAIERDARTPSIEIALDAGYSDQAHFHREFRAFAGMTPDLYRRADRRHPHHVPVSAS